MEISKKTMKKLLKGAGADKASEGALEELSETLELYAGYITEEALELSKEHKNRALKKEDIEKALE